MANRRSTQPRASVGLLAMLSLCLPTIGSTGLASALPPASDPPAGPATEVRTPPPAKAAEFIDNVTGNDLEELYPPAAKRDGIESVTPVRLDIDENGVVTKVTVQTDPGHGFAEAARRFGRRMRFRPARDAAGKPHPSSIEWTINWMIDDSQGPAEVVAVDRKGCEGGDAGQCAVLAERYEHGDGVLRDPAQAMALYQRACEGGIRSICALLGAKFFRGDGVPKDAARAASGLKQACDGGVATGCNDLGTLYATGQGVPKDAVKAAALFKQACDGGNAAGCANLGSGYARGVGVPRDAVMATFLFKQACDGGVARACTALGTMAGSKGSVSTEATKATASPPATAVAALARPATATKPRFRTALLDSIGIDLGMSEVAAEAALKQRFALVGESTIEGDKVVTFGPGMVGSLQVRNLVVVSCGVVTMVDIFLDHGQTDLLARWKAAASELAARLGDPDEKSTRYTRALARELWEFPGARLRSVYVEADPSGGEPGTELRIHFAVLDEACSKPVDPAKGLYDEATEAVGERYAAARKSGAHDDACAAAAQVAAAVERSGNVIGSFFWKQRAEKACALAGRPVP